VAALDDIAAKAHLGDHEATRAPSQNAAVPASSASIPLHPSHQIWFSATAMSALRPKADKIVGVSVGPLGANRVLTRRSKKHRYSTASLLNMRDYCLTPLTATMLNFAYFSPILSAA
jgi:hypothetical protein